MNDNKNMALSDELFADVSGGFGIASSQKIYDAVGIVIMLLKDGSYMVRFDDGGEIDVPRQERHFPEHAGDGFFQVQGDDMPAPRLQVVQNVPARRQSRVRQVAGIGVDAQPRTAH